MTDTATTLAVTITYLEMAAPPEAAFPDLPAGARFERVMQPSVRFYRYLYDAVGHVWLWWERRMMRDAALARVIHHPHVEVHVLTLDGEPMGFCEVDFRVPEAPDLALFGLVPDATGKGLGPAMMGRVLDLVWSRPETRRLTLNTCTLDSPHALEFYRRAGFEPVRTESKIIRDPRLRRGWEDGPGLLKDAVPTA